MRDCGELLLVHGGLGLLVIDEDLLGDLIARVSQVHLMEWLGLVEPVAVLSPHHVSVQVLLCLPSGAVKEVHSSGETGCGHGASTLRGELH